VYNHPASPMSPAQAMQKVIDDALLAQHARNTLAQQILNEENKVGFLREVQQQDRVTALIRKANEVILYQQIKQLPGGSLDGIYQFNSDFTKELLAQKFALESKVNIEASPQQIRWAKQTPVAEVKLPSGIKTLTLWDIYRRQNVQGRLAFHSGDLDFVKGHAEQRVGSLFVLDWAQQNLSAADWQAIRQIVKNEQDKNTLLKTMGLYADVHDDNPVLRKRAQQVTDKEVEAFYHEHKDEFEVVEKVKARHIQLNSQQEADRVYEEIKHGLNFADAVKKYSLAEDKNNSLAGDLGWLKRKDKNRSWLHSVAFTQPAGQVSMPFRSPQNQGEIVYEIIWVDERVDGYLPITDPTVRYEASRDVALKQLKAEFYQLQKTLRDQADVHLNKSAIRALTQ